MQISDKRCDEFTIHIFEFKERRIIYVSSFKSKKENMALF